MKRHLSRSIFLELQIISLLCLSVQSSTYYVDFAGGDDSHTGTSTTTAWKHAPGDPNATGTAQKVLVAGDIVLFKSGVNYRGSVTINVSGGDGNPIIYKGDGWGSAKAIIDGSDQVAGWTKCASGAECGNNPNWQHIYHATAPTTVTAFSANLHEGDTILWLAQGPDQPDPLFIDLLSNYYDVPAAQITRTTIIDAGHLTQTDAHAWDNAYVGAWVNPNDVVFSKITGFVPAEHKIIFKDLGGDPYPDRVNKYSCINSPNVLDKAGEYYLDEKTHTIYLWPLDESTFSTRMTVQVRTNGFYFPEHSNITIEGFIVRMTFHPITNNNGNTTANHGITIRNNNVGHNSNGEPQGYGGINLDHCSNCLVESNNVRENTFHRGIFLTGSDHCIVKNNTVVKPGCTGISNYSCSNNQIINNTISDGYSVHGNGMSFYLSCSHELIAGNRVTNSNIALTMQSSGNITLYNNIFDGSLRTTYIVASWGGMSGTVTLANNAFIGSTNNASIYFADAGARLVYLNNILDGFGQTAGNHNLYTGINWVQGSSWQPGSGDILGPQVPNNDHYTAIDMSTVFVNAPRINASIIQFDNDSTLAIDDIYHQIAQPGDYIVIDNNPGIARRVVTAARVVENGNLAIRIVFSPALSPATGSSVAIWKSNTDFTCNYALFSGSRAVEKGANAAASLPSADFPGFDFTKDIDGNSRSVGSAWDIGPYEYSTAVIANQNATNKDFPHAGIYVSSNGLIVNVPGTSPYRVDIIDMRGRIIQQASVDRGNQGIVTLSKVPSGTFLIRIKASGWTSFDGIITIAK